MNKETKIKNEGVFLMAKVHQLQRVQKTNTNKVNTAQKARLPILPRLLSWMKIKKAQHSKYTYAASWNAAYKIFTLLHSISKGVKKLKVLIVNSTFKVASTEVEAVIMDYSNWLSMKVQAEKVRGIHSYTFGFELLDNRSIGAVIKGEHTEVTDTMENLVELRKTDDNTKPRRNSTVKTVLVEEYFFVYIRDIGLYGMIRVQHQEYMQKNESLDIENEVA